MTTKFDGTEFFKMMAVNEQATAAMYRQFAANTRLGAQFFENLAKDEERHYGIYTALLTKYAASKGLTVEVSDDQADYLNLLVKNNAVKDADTLTKKAAKFSNKDEYYGLAEQGERDAVLFVQELIGLYPMLQPDDFKVILKEEKDHLKQVMSRRMEGKLGTLRL